MCTPASFNRSGLSTKTIFFTKKKSSSKWREICTGILVHNIEELYVNKFQKGSWNRTTKASSARSIVHCFKTERCFLSSLSPEIELLNRLVFEKKMSDFVQVSPTKSEVSLFPLCVEENWILKSQLTQGSSPKSQHCSPPLSSPVNLLLQLQVLIHRLQQSSTGWCTQDARVAANNLLPPVSQQLKTCHLKKIKRTNIQSQTWSFMIVLLNSAMSDRHNKTGPRAGAWLQSTSGSLLIHA